MLIFEPLYFSIPNYPQIFSVIFCCHEPSGLKWGNRNQHTFEARQAFGWQPCSGNLACKHVWLGWDFSTETGNASKGTFHCHASDSPSSPCRKCSLSEGDFLNPVTGCDRDTFYLSSRNIKRQINYDFRVPTVNCFESNKGLTTHSSFKASFKKYCTTGWPQSIPWSRLNGHHCTRQIF